MADREIKITVTGPGQGGGGAGGIAGAVKGGGGTQSGFAGALKGVLAAPGKGIKGGMPDLLGGSAGFTKMLGMLGIVGGA